MVGLSEAQLIQQVINKPDNFNVPGKHLAGAGGNYAQFITASKDEVIALTKEALSKAPQYQSFYVNNNNIDQSIIVVVNMGREVGTKGQTYLRNVVDTAGNIWTAFPTF